MDLLVLAGGKSRRMGESPGRAAALVMKEFGLDSSGELPGNAGKASFRFDKLSLIERVIDRLRPLFENVIISSADGESYPGTGTMEVADIYRNSGSLGGLHASLTAAKSEKAFAVACDMPFVNPRLVEFLIGKADEYDVVVPRTTGEQEETVFSKMLLEPLHAIYSKSCIPHMEKLLNAGNLRIFDFYDKVETCFVYPERIRQHDPGMLSFFNINTPDDLRKAYRILAERAPNKTASEG